MSKKLSILATALTLGRFTVAELASRSGATPATVHTVLGRAPSDWFLKSQQASGNRGGQPVGYELTETGRAAIEGELHKVTPATLTRLAPEQPPLDEPLGLVAAREILAELPLAKPEVSAGLREDALGNLQWAQAEVQGGAFAAYRERLLEDISRLRAQLAWRPFSPWTSMEIRRHLWTWCSSPTARCSCAVASPAVSCSFPWDRICCLQPQLRHCARPLDVWTPGPGR